MAARLPLTVVELFGLPGAGKSTLARALWPADAVRLARDQRAGLGPLMARAAAFPKLAAAGLLVGRAAGGPVGAQLGALSAVLERQIALAKLPSGAGAFLDEGLAQGLLSLCLEGTRRPSLEALVAFFEAARLGTPHQLVVVDTPPEVAAARLAGRASQHSRLNRRSAAAQRERLGFLAPFIPHIALAAAAAGVEVVAADGLTVSGAPRFGRVGP